MSEYLKQFEKETGIDVHMQTTEEENYHRLWQCIYYLEICLKATEKKLEKVIECLKWYGDKKTWWLDYEDIPNPIIHNDMGKRAIECLKQITEE